MLKNFRKEIVEEFYVQEILTKVYLLIFSIILKNHYG